MRYSSVIALSTLLAVTLATPQPQIEDIDPDDTNALCISDCYDNYLDALNSGDDAAAAISYSECTSDCYGIFDDEDVDVDEGSDSEEVAEGDDDDDDDDDGSDIEDVEDVEDVEDASDVELAEGDEEDEEPPTSAGEDAASNVHLSVSVLALAGLVISFFNF